VSSAPPPPPRRRSLRASLTRRGLPCEGSHSLPENHSIRASKTQLEGQLVPTVGAGSTGRPDDLGALVAQLVALAHRRTPHPLARRRRRRLRARNRNAVRHYRRSALAAAAGLGAQNVRGLTALGVFFMGGGMGVVGGCDAAAAVVDSNGKMAFWAREGGLWRCLELGGRGSAPGVRGSRMGSQRLRQLEGYRLGLPVVRQLQTERQCPARGR